MQVGWWLFGGARPSDTVSSCQSVGGILLGRWRSPKKAAQRQASGWRPTLDAEPNQPGAGRFDRTLWLATAILSQRPRRTTRYGVHTRGHGGPTSLVREQGFYHKQSAARQPTALDAERAGMPGLTIPQVGGPWITRGKTIAMKGSSRAARHPLQTCQGEGGCRA